MRPPSAVWLTLLLCVLSACGARLGRGRERWRSVESEHFVLYTDLSREQALNEGRELEELLSGLMQSGWETRGKLPVKLNVVMFSNPSDLERYTKGRVSGYHVPNRMLLFLEPWTVVAANRQDPTAELETVAHELTHYLAFQAMPRQPLWFSEGLASYFQSGHYAEDGRFVLGSVPFQRAPGASAGPLPPSQLVGKRLRYDTAGVYASSWLLVHYLMTKEGEAFQDYQRYLAAGMPDERAWARAFPRLPLNVMDATIEGYWLTNMYGEFLVRIVLPEVRLVERTLSRADEFALQAALCISAWEPSMRDRRCAQQAIADALTEAPLHLRASELHVMQSMHDPKAALAEARTLMKRHPEQWLPAALVMFAAAAADEALPSSGEYDLGRAVALAPWQPFAWLAQGLQEALRGEKENALRSADRARSLQPANVEVLTLRLMILRRISACEAFREGLAVLEQDFAGELSEKALQALKAELPKCSGSY